MRMFLPPNIHMGLKDRQPTAMGMVRDKSQKTIIFSSSLHIKTTFPYRYITSRGISETRPIWLKDAGQRQIQNRLFNVKHAYSR